MTLSHCILDVFVDDLVALHLGRLSVLERSQQLEDDLELSPEERVLAHVHLVPVHLEQLEVDSGNGLDEALERRGQLELPEEADGGAAGGGAGQADLAVDDDGCGDGGALQRLGQGVEVSLEGSSRVADGDAVVCEAGVGLLDVLDDIVKRFDFLDIQHLLLLEDVEDLEFAIGDLTFNDLYKLQFVVLDGVPGDVAELSVLAYLVWWPGADGGAVDVDDRLLPHVDPDNLAVLGVVLATGLLDGGLEPGDGRLSAAEDLVAGDATEVGAAVDGIGKFLDLVEMIGHGDRLPYFRIGRHGVASRSRGGHG